MSIEIDHAESQEPHRRTVRVGLRTRSARHASGPLGTGLWETWHLRSEDDNAHVFQDVEWEVVERAAILGPGGVRIPVWGATLAHLQVLNATLALVPTEHLAFFVSEKPQGIGMVSYAASRAAASPMGGLNAGHDFSWTPFDDTQAIQITYGAMVDWCDTQGLPICPTVLHEIGHVMTHAGGGLNFSRVDPGRWAALRQLVVSRNDGADEALCNAYMYFLCWTSIDDAVHRLGERQSDIQRDARTRDALRACPAFASLTGAGYELTLGGFESTEAQRQGWRSAR
jgi:hypothetical protein